MNEYERGYEEGRRNTAREMAKSALKVEKRLRNEIAKLQQIVDYLKSCASCAEFNHLNKHCILQKGTCVNFNKWRMPE